MNEIWFPGYFEFCKNINIKFPTLTDFMRSRFNIFSLICSCNWKQIIECVWHPGSLSTNFILYVVEKTAVTYNKVKNKSKSWTCGISNYSKTFSPSKTATKLQYIFLFRYYINTLKNRYILIQQSALQAQLL